MTFKKVETVKAKEAERFFAINQRESFALCQNL